MSEDKLGKRVSRGKRASLLIQDELLNEAFEKLQRTYTDALMQTHPLAKDEREKFYLAFNIVGKVREHLGHVLNDGKLAQAELDKLNAAPTRG